MATASASQRHDNIEAATSHIHTSFTWFLANSQTLLIKPLAVSPDNGSMVSQFLQFFRTLISDADLARAYEKRRLSSPDKGNRTVANVALLLALLLGIMTFVGSMFFIERDTQSYLTSRNRVRVIHTDESTWWIYESSDRSCLSDPTCVKDGSKDLKNIRKVTWDELRRVKNISTTPQTYHLRANVGNSQWKSLEEYLTLVISFPVFQHDAATLFLSGDLQRRFFLGRPLNFPFETSHHKGKSLTIDAIMTVSPGQTLLTSGSQPLFISTQAEFESFNEFQTMRRSGKGNWIAVVSRITLALFAIGLFLMIDASPESLGLALFMGFEALGIATKQGWMPLSFLGAWWDIFASSLFLNLGVVFRMYFYTQITRLAPKATKPWFMAAVIFAVPMALYAMASASKPGGFYNTTFAAANLSVALAGLIFSVRVFFAIRKQNLRWRHMAIFSSILASIPTILIMADQIAGKVFFSSFSSDLLNAAHFNSGFLLALSAFFNISSLENRVLSLSIAKARSDIIEHELELGRTVQRAFLNIPKMPKDFDVVGSHEAAVFVSGDVYFVNWDETDQRLAVVLTDITGHGVQASLKATACYMLASNLWKSRRAGDGRSDASKLRSRLSAYHKQSSDLLSLFNEIPDITAFAGVEIFARESRAYLYRNNFYSPIILEPDNKGSWVVTMPGLQVAELVEYTITPGTIIAIFSDGFVTGSRQLSRLRLFLSERLSQFDGRASSLKNLFADFDTQNHDRPDDDRTLIVFTWKVDSYLKDCQKKAS